MMMMFLVMTSGQLLVRSMVEEKSNRIVEVLMSSCSAKDLMVGKILGLSGLGFTQIGFWALIGITLALKFSITLISISHALLLLIFFVLGYLFYAAIFVAVGSPLSTEQEAQQATSYLVLIFIIPLIIAMPVMQDPNSLMVTVLTFIPFLTPTMMALRIPIQMPSEVEIIASILVLGLSTVFAMWAAAKIFRTAILAYGKRPSIKEIISLLKTK
jgi:ABC-2 type transport system permease protein